MHAVRSQTQNRSPVVANRRRRGPAGDDEGGRRSPPRSSLRSSVRSNANAMAMIAEIECKADEGTAKAAPLYKKGMEVYYRNRGPNGPTIVPARIIEVHYDDSMEPYYTILREDGSEKQTDDDHITLCPTDPEPCANNNMAETEAVVTEKLKPLGSLHQGNAGVLRVDDGVRVFSLDEQREKREQKGMCPNCGEVQTHKPGLLRPWIPDTEDGLVYKGVCLKCNNLDAAKTKLGEPIDVPGTHRYKSSIELQHPNSYEAEKDNIHSFQARQNSPDRSRSYIAHLGDVMDRRSTGSHTGRSSHLTSSATRPTRDPPSIASDGVKKTSVRDFKRRGSMPTLKSMVTPARRMEWVRHSLEPRGRELGDSPRKSEDPLLRRERTVSTTEPDSTLASSITSSYEDFKCLAELSILARRRVREFRCSDSDGGFGFYTGTVATIHAGTIDKQDVPHGRGEMVYDDGKIANGIWSKGTLNVKVPPARDRYEPYLLPGYAVGDMGQRDDMVRATAAAISRLHVEDCAFIRRSDTKKPWSYAIVKSRSDGDDVSITFQVNSRSSTKTIGASQWAGHIRLPVKPDILPGYAVGDPGWDEDMIIASQEEVVLSASNLRINDAAFVQRSHGGWEYAIVKHRCDGDDGKITFKINPKGHTKSIQISQCGRCVRRVKQEHPGFFDEELESIPQSTGKTESPRRQSRRILRDEVVMEGDMVKFPASHRSTKNQQQHPKKSSSFLWEESQEELERDYKEDSTKSCTYQSQSRQSFEMHKRSLCGQVCDYEGKCRGKNHPQCSPEMPSALSIYDNHNRNAKDDRKSSFSTGCSSLTAFTDQSKDELFSSILARMRRKAALENAGCSLDSSMTESLIRNIVCDETLKKSWESFKRARRANYNEKERMDGKRKVDEGCSSITDGSQQIAKDSMKDKVLMGLIARAAMEDIAYCNASEDVSLDESMINLKESFVKWRKQENMKKSSGNNNKDEKTR